jgi:hypothetical protein
MYALPRMWTVVYVAVTATLAAAFVGAIVYSEYEDRGERTLTLVRSVIHHVGWPMVAVGIIVIIFGPVLRVSLTFRACVALLFVLCLFSGP